ncbi:hypothetical protein GOP47_0025139 [Adiantum capillus-veneris]|uniref:HIT domain-containing protein n=1 Tax=Adiantum capillus-veneris TaxID=13818 RepID=A0A9D4U5A3_ADICA|nr:hypothetical protein GOP47_0025139 [Adiantum capillus-veneris]
MLRTSRAIAACFVHSVFSSSLTRSAPYKLSVRSRLLRMVLSGRSSPCFIKPITFQAENINPAMLISYRDCCNVSKGKKLDFECTKLPLKDFCTFIETEPKSEVVAFFRELATELESKLKILDFHMRVVNCEEGFKVEVFYGSEKLGPPVLPPSNCISCYPNAPLFPGQEPIVEARECVLEEFSSQPHAVCRLDAKGRCGFIITPTRHVDRMSELDDEELFGLWSLAVRVLREANLPFTTMILNHGTYRNVEHLHLKVWVEKNLYEQYRAQWSNERQELWRQLQDLALKRPRTKRHSKKH